MTLFSRLFRKATPAAAASPPAEQRTPATDAAPAVSEEAAQAAAILNLPDGDILRGHAGLTADAGGAQVTASGAVERAAQNRLAQLIDEGAIDFERLCEQSSNRNALFSVAALCKDPSLLQRALARLPDPDQVAHLVLHSTSSRVRQLAAEIIEDPAQLRSLLKQVRGKDKNVNKILKHKVDALNAADRLAAQIAEETAAICASLERHSHRGHDALYASTFEHLCGRWRSIAAKPDADSEIRANRAIDRCKDVIAEHLRLAAQRAAEQAEHQAREAARAIAARQAQEAAAAAEAEEERRRREADALRTAEEAEQARKLAATEQLFRQIGGLIRKANEALGEGTTQKAAGLRRAIEEKRSDAPELPVHLARGLQQLDEKLNELKRWKDFAVAPKRSELIEEMQRLIGVAEDPQILSERIKSIQQEWRTISKGIVSDVGEDWDRFHQASQAAYQPCADYFAAQAKIRQDNLDGRRALTKRLAAFEESQNAGNPDWRLIARVLREAPQEWRRYFPVDREPGRTVQREYDVLISRLKVRLDAWHGQHAEEKSTLIKRARHLLTQEDGREAVDAVKRLQAQWKDVGPASREQEQSLWNEFREVCDAVYQKRQQAFAEYAAALEGSKANAVALCEEIERAADLSGEELSAAAGKIAGWRTAFESLGEMPRADARGLQIRFERAAERCETQLGRQRERDAEQAYVNLFQASRHLQALGWATAQGCGDEQREALKAAAESFIAGVNHWPKGAMACIKDASARASSQQQTEFASREAALRNLCVRGEILSEMATPSEDEATRREYQVQRLIQGMGQGVKPDDWHALSLDWIRHLGISPEVYDRLEERFLNAREKRHLPDTEQLNFRRDGGVRDANVRDGGVRDGGVRDRGAGSVRGQGAGDRQRPRGRDRSPARNP